MKKVLIIEDDKDVAVVVQKRLEAQNFFVVEILTTSNMMFTYLKNGEEPDFVILDLKLVESFSADMLGVLYSRWKKTKVYIYTAYPEYSEKYPFLKDIVCGIFSKLELEKLIKTMKIETSKKIN